MQAIILAGGFGTRLRQLVPDVPKPMAPVAGRPFLAWLLEYLSAQGVREIILSVHYHHRLILEQFGSRFACMRIQYHIEDEKLGTGGAIAAAMKLCDRSQPVFALNGDSLVQADYSAMMRLHQQSGTKLTMAVREVSDCSRYSVLNVACGHVLGFERLGTPAPGHISAGLYVMQPDLFDAFPLPPVFSLEDDFFAHQIAHVRPAAYAVDGYFIDIGVPDDYKRACVEIPQVMGHA